MEEQVDDSDVGNECNIRGKREGGRKSEIRIEHVSPGNAYCKFRLFPSLCPSSANIERHENGILIFRVHADTRARKSRQKYVRGT